MASGAPGGNFRTWTPTPPDRGSFPLDHFGECKDQMTQYLKCLRLTGNQNSPNCRILAKNYLQCRMDNQLMDKSDWDSLGLINLPEKNSEKVGNGPKSGGFGDSGGDSANAGTTPVAEPTDNVSTSNTNPPS